MATVSRELQCLGEIYKFVHMPKQKFYAIKSPEWGKIVNSWEECEAIVRGTKGLKYKSFSTMPEAQRERAHTSTMLSVSLQQTSVPNKILYQLKTA